MSWKIEIEDRDGKMVGNAIRLATKEEAEGHAAELYSRWMGCPSRPVAVECDDPVNYTFKDWKLCPLERPDLAVNKDRIEL